jgi:hypothetical protein
MDHCRPPRWKRQHRRGHRHNGGARRLRPVPTTWRARHGALSACDRDQARIVHRYVRANFQDNALLRPFLVRETAEAIELSNAVEIIVATNSFRAVRGRTIVCAIFDEVAYWLDEQSARPDRETYAAVIPGLATLPTSMLIGISTPYRRSGLLFDQWRRYYGKPDDDVLVVRGASLLFNPTIPRRLIDRDAENDPERAAAEWFAEWRSDLADFVSRDVVMSVTPSGLIELPPGGSVHYAAFVDPSGGSSDAMTLAIGHAERDGRAVLDAIREVRPPFSPEAVVAEFAALLRSYRITSVQGDRYAGEWPRERFRHHGIAYEPCDSAKSDLYAVAEQ